MQFPESREVSEAHANRLSRAWARTSLSSSGSSPDIFTAPQDEIAIAEFVEDVLNTVKSNVDHGRGTAIVLAERILAKARKKGQRAVMWLPVDADAPQDWEQAAQMIFNDIALGDYDGAGEAYHYLVANTKDYTDLAKLVGMFVTANYFLKNSQKSSESA